MFLSLYNRALFSPQSDDNKKSCLYISIQQQQQQRMELPMNVKSTLIFNSLLPAIPGAGKICVSLSSRVILIWPFHSSFFVSSVELQPPYDENVFCAKCPKSFNESFSCEKVKWKWKLSSFLKCRWEKLFRERANDEWRWKLREKRVNYVWRSDSLISVE